MTPILKSLLWKEFHELKSGTAAAAAIVLAIPGCYIFRDLGMAYLGVHTALWIYPIIAGIFFGMRLAAGERTNRVASFVAGLPVSHAALGTVRLAAALVAAFIPLSLVAMLGIALAPLVEPSVENQALAIGVVWGLSALGTVFCITTVARGGLGQPSEIQAALIGSAALIGTVIALYFVLLAFMSLLSVLHSNGILLRPDAALWLLTGTGYVTIGALSILFGGIFVAHYSRALALPANRRRTSWSINHWMPAPISSQVATLLRKGIREMGLLALYVFLIALLLSVVVGSLGLFDPYHPSNVSELVAKAMPAMLMVGGFVLAILVGVGAVIGDVQPGVNTFWRSRPISPSAWYWTKYGIGLATILIAITIPFVLNPFSRSISGDGGLLWWPLIWNVTFSFALTFTCLVRQPAHAAILAVGAAGILYAMIQAAFGSFTPGEPPAPTAILAAGFLVAFAVSTFVGYIVAVRDLVIS